MRSFLLDRSTAHVTRWHHRPTIKSESIAEHHALTARIAFFVAILGQRHKIDWFDSVDPYRVAAAALFHDEAEVVTGDVPGDQKKLHPDLRNLAWQLERRAALSLVEQAPALLEAEYAFRLFGNGVGGTGLEVLKYADDLAALAFVEDEIRMGNGARSILDTHGGIAKHIAGLDWPWLVRLRECEPGLP